MVGGDIENNVSKGLGSVLLMDDEETIRSYGTSLLNHLGYSVETVSDGEEAISLFTERKNVGQPFDVVVLDINIPKGSGGEYTIKRLLDVDPDIKAVVSSGDMESHLMRDYKKYGFSAALPKPYSTGKLREVMEALFSTIDREFPGANSVMPGRSPIE
jgi:CheY-like chemotaxis protein